MAIHPKSVEPVDPSILQPSMARVLPGIQFEPVSASSSPAPSGVRGTSVSLAIPLDEGAAAKPNTGIEPTTELHHGVDVPSVHRPRHEPIRRDSLKRREALLKGKEGSRRRQRWENDRLLNNPWAQPPLPSDWEVHPTYPKHTVPYYLAPLWDSGMASKAKSGSAGKPALAKRHEEDAASNPKVPKELREKLKKMKAAKGLLQDLEEQVRRYVKQWEEKNKKAASDQKQDLDSEDEEIVFVGRNGQMHDVPLSPHATKDDFDEDDIQQDKLVFDSLADDHGASFGRWLVHSIANYYGLRTYSLNVGNPARREAYVGMKNTAPSSHARSLPRPLWGMV